jgi:hypothetical protein
MNQIPEKMQKAIEVLEEAKAEFEATLFGEMDRVARANNLDQMLFWLGNSYLRDDEKVSVPELDVLDGIYCDYIHKGGFQGVWTKENGWE